MRQRARRSAQPLGGTSCRRKIHEKAKPQVRARLREPTASLGLLGKRRAERAEGLDQAVRHARGTMSREGHFSLSLAQTSIGRGCRL
jgi:hypothetical protein